MLSAEVTDATEIATVNMGQIVVGRAPQRLGAVLGSCVGIALWHPRFQVGCLAHVVLPHSKGASAVPGKFADTALPNMISMLANHGANSAGLVAKLAGGASLFEKKGPLQIGQSNCEAVEELLRKARIPVVGKHLGGTKGRRVRFDCATGDYLIEIAGSPPVVL